MTSRMVVAYGAMAALALMISGVVAARAAVQNCTIYPERCQYGANGGAIFLPARLPHASARRSDLGQRSRVGLRCDGRNSEGGVDRGVIRTEPLPRTAPFQPVQSAGRAAKSSAATLPSTATINRT